MSEERRLERQNFSHKLRAHAGEYTRIWKQNELMMIMIGEEMSKRDGFLIRQRNRKAVEEEEDESYEKRQKYLCISTFMWKY